MNILHISYDEKFIDFAADLFDGYEQASNRYVVVVDSMSAPLRYVAMRPGMQRVDRTYAASAAAAADLAWADVLIVHYLGLDAARLVLRAPARVRVVWSGWGGDYHELLDRTGSALLGAETHAMVAAMRAGAGGLRSLPARFRRRAGAVRAKLVTEPLLHRAAARADFFSAPIPEDFDLLRAALGDSMGAEYAQLNYGSLEHTFAPGGAAIRGDSILVGNSASPSNNHADVFALLATLPLGSRRIIVPLSYGDAAYRDAVIARGRELFGERFVPIVDFLALEQYNALIAECSVAIMGHRRQQGLGNIGTMMLLGARVFVDPASTVYRHFRSRGAVVNSLGELANGDASVLLPLTPGERAANREVLAGTWGQDVVHRNLQSLLARLEPVVA